MKIFMMRHGESKNNRDGLWTGQFDAELTERGKAQAAQAGKNLAGVRFDKIVSSNLLRAKMTAELAIPGCQCELSDALREIDLGSLAGKPYNGITDAQRNECAMYGYGMFGGEAKADFQNRVLEYMKTLETAQLDEFVMRRR